MKLKYAVLFLFLVGALTGLAQFDNLLKKGLEKGGKLGKKKAVKIG